MNQDSLHTHTHYGSPYIMIEVMPCKATLFNNNSDPIHDFGTGHRNLAQFNPHGNNILSK